jgi:hypothetical protein
MSTERYKEAENTYIESLLTSPLQAGNILHDWVGTTKDGRDYEFTTNEDEAKSDDSKILLVRDRNGNLVPELSTEQEEWMRDQIRKGLRSRLDYESDININRSGGSGGSGPSVGERKNIERAKSLYSLYTGDPETIQEGVSLLRGQKDRNGFQVIDIDRSGSSISLTLSDSKGKKVVESMPIGEDPRTFVTSLMNRFFGDSSGVEYVNFGDSAPGQGEYSMSVTEIESGDKEEDDGLFSTDSGVSLIAKEVLMKDGNHIIGRITEDDDVQNIKSRVEAAIVKHAPNEMAKNVSVIIDPNNDDGLMISYGNKTWTIDLDNNTETVDNLGTILKDMRKMYYEENGSGAQSNQSVPKASKSGGSSR